MQSLGPTPEDRDGQVSPIAEEEQMRANVYALLSALLISPPDERLLGVVRGLERDGSEFGTALGDLSDCAANMTPDDIVDEFTRLFFGHGAGGELHPYASYYLTGFVYEKPLADLREDLGILGRAKSDATSEPEDHIAILLNTIHDLIVGEHGEPVTLEGQKEFFNKHIAPWAGRFFADLENAENAEFYRPLGAIGRLLMDIEDRAFSIAA